MILEQLRRMGAMRAVLATPQPTLAACADTDYAPHYMRRLVYVRHLLPRPRPPVPKPRYVGTLGINTMRNKQ